jgi:hypothetical protein
MDIDSILNKKNFYRINVQTETEEDLRRKSKQLKAYIAEFLKEKKEEK